jgi:2'-hydroxyisoflavone reductase
MNSNRRQFIKTGMLAGAAVSVPGVVRSVASSEQPAEFRALNILVLGGTGFIGPHMVREALRRGHSVTLFNRGRTNSGLFPDLEKLKGDRDGGLGVLKGRSWDAVIDNSGYIPRLVGDSTRLLAKNAEQYLFISSISAYASFEKPLDEDSPLATMEDETFEKVTNESYGALKVLCEKKARAEFGGDRLTVLRPTYICGPGDRSDRFSYWPVRTSKGGEMLLPGTPEHPLQIIDVRDLAHFTIDCLQGHITGIYNMVTPVGSYNMGNLLADSLAVSGAEVNPVWVDETFVAQHGLVDSGEIPIWHALSGPDAAASSVSGVRARAAGLHNRPIRETIRDLLKWWQTLPEERTGKMRAGLSAEREAELIAAWKSTKS